MKVRPSLPLLAALFALLLAAGLAGSAVSGDTQSVGAMTAGATAADRQQALEQQVFPRDKVVDVKITIDEDEFQDMLDNAAAEEMKPASVEYNGIKLDNIGIRTKGNLSLRSVVSSDSDRYSFKLSFDEYISSQTLMGISKINLNNNYSDATYMREFLTYELAEQMGLPTPEFSYVNVYVNGELWGFYLAIEQIGDAYLERHFGNAYGALYKAEFGMGGGGGGGFGGFPGGELPEGFPGGFPGGAEGAQFGGGLPGRGADGGFPAGEDGGNQAGGTRAAADGEQGGGVPGGNNGRFPGGQGQGQGQSQGQGQVQGQGQGQGQSQGQGQDQNQVQGGNRVGGQGGNRIGGGGGSSGGGDLAWKDDDLASYPSLVQKSKSSNDNILIDMLDELNNGGDYESVLNVGDALQYIALNAVTANMDSYLGSNQQNYYLYEDDGIFSVLPWDYNMAFGGMGGGGSSILIDEPTQGAVADRPLVAKLLAVDEYKEQYHQIIRGMVEGYLANGTFTARVQEIKEMISPYVQADPRPFYTYEQYESAIPQLIAFTSGVVDNVTAQLDGTSPSSGDGSGSGGGFGGMGGMGNFGGFGGMGGRAGGQVGQMPNGQGGQVPNGQGVQVPNGQDSQMPNGQGDQMPNGPGGGFGGMGGPGGFGGGDNASQAPNQEGAFLTTIVAMAALGAAGSFVVFYRRKRL